MAKNKKNRDKSTENRASSRNPRQKNVEKTPRNVERAEPVSDSDPLLRKVFWGIAVVGLLWMLVSAMGVGLNADDKFQNDYSEKLVNYYSSFGQDTAALFVKDGNMHIYGGFFEVITGFANKALGLGINDAGYHDLRHLSSAFLGWVAILCAALLAGLIAGWRAAIFTFILMLLSPRFFGHSLMNPKDIPFAAGYTMAIYNLAAVLKRMSKPKWSNLAGLAGGLGITLALRAGGLLTFIIVLFFGGLFFLWKNGFAGLGKGSLLGKYAAALLGSSAVGYILGILFWPWAMQAPIDNPMEALSKFEDFAINIRVLYEGQNIMSDTTPATYASNWVWMTIPLATIAGFFGFFAFLPKMYKKYEPVLLALVAFAGIFPIAYVVYKNSKLYDGWRHLIFAYPALAVMAALFWNELVQFFEGKKVLQYVAIGAFALLLADAAFYQMSNSKLSYTYFNPLQGGVKGAFGHYETDYYGLSIRQGVEWLEKEGIVGENMDKKIVIATNMFYPAMRYLAKYKDNVKVQYMKWDRRCDYAYDYALFPSRFIDGAALQAGKWPQDNVVHTIDAGGVPMLSILKYDNTNCFDGAQAAKTGNWPVAVEKMKAEVAAVPDNELAWGTLANALLQSGQLEEAKSAAEKGLEINPNDTQSSNTIGMYYLNKNDIAAAKSHFEASLKREPSNPGALYYLATIVSKQGNNNQALQYLQQAIQLAPNFRPAFELAAQIHQSMGNTQQANQIRQMMR